MMFYFKCVFRKAGSIREKYETNIKQRKFTFENPKSFLSASYIKEVIIFYCYSETIIIL